MGNQQGKATEVQLAWLAGFLDGEGCFDLQKGYAKQLKRESYRPRIRVVNTDEPTLAAVLKIMEAMGAGQHVSRRRAKQGHWSDSWEVTVAGFKKGLRFLLQIEPYLKTKSNRAKQLIEYAESRLTDSPKRPFSEREITLINQIRRKELRWNPQRLHATHGPLEP
ncbi:hypothetical protein LCGC14_1967810 [marine sediment metagenome]|uniref:Homing endonuclease LAGLIDADG domain-containing protein n=1 Tax=marine sediment metagenome TaxID=412755 RepID=A0A0F9G0W3_9ZZZZ